MGRGKDSSNPSERKSKRLRNNDDHQVPETSGRHGVRPCASSRASLPLFLPCHLVMLRSLYEGTSGSVSDKVKKDGSKHTDGPVDDQVWRLAKIFLEKRSLLVCHKKHAVLMGGVHAEAVKLFSSRQGGSSSTINQEKGWEEGGGDKLFPSLKMLPSPFGGSGLQRQRSYYGATPSYVTQPYGSSYGMRLFSSPGPDLFHFHHLRQHHQIQPPVDSWAMMTSLLKRKRAAAERNSDSLAGPFRPLLDAAESRVRVLCAALRRICGARAACDRKKALHVTSHNRDRLRSFDSSLNDCAENPAFMQDVAWISAKADSEENEIAEIETKIRLWHWLACSLKDVTG